MVNMISTTWWKYCGIEMLIWIPPRRHSLFHVVFFIFFIRSIFLPEVPKEACYFSQFLPHASYMGFADNPAKPDKGRQIGGKGEEEQFSTSKILQHTWQNSITRCITHIIHASWKHPCHSRAWQVLPGTLKLYLQIQFLVLAIWSRWVMHKQTSLLSHNIWEDKWNSGNKFWAIIHIETTPGDISFHPIHVSLLI